MAYGTRKKTTRSGKGKGTDKWYQALGRSDQKKMNEMRGLMNYRLHYRNRNYPVLSFLYAIFAGGEHTLYCDHTEDYVAEYLTSPRLTGARRKRLMKVLAYLEKHRYDEYPPYPSSQDWDDVLELLKAELYPETAMAPHPVW
ncbi:MAG TPA: hypothetical protein VF989_13565 [Polyangiaceae bacterium]|jgi:hypothetical protein